jgi:hypothetical protein
LPVLILVQHRGDKHVTGNAADWLQVVMHVAIQTKMVSKWLV